MGNESAKRAIDGRMYESAARELAGERWDYRKWKEVSKDDNGASVSIEAWETLVATYEAWEQVELLNDMEIVPSSSSKLTTDQTTRESHLICAKACRTAGMYREMADEMKWVVENSQGSISIHERDLLLQAFKGAINIHRKRFDILKDEIKHCIGEEYLARGTIQQRLNGVARSIEEISWSLIKLIDTLLYPKAILDEEKVFYIKLKADFYRYLIEVEPDTNAIEVTLDLYSKAYTLACDNLWKADPIRLAVALNYSIFLRDYCDQHDRGISLIRDAHENALDATISIANIDKEILDLIDLFKAYVEDKANNNMNSTRK